jgi:hypothetical protein
MIYKSETSVWLNPKFNKELSNLIGQKILDIGLFYDQSPLYKTREDIKNFWRKSSEEYGLDVFSTEIARPMSHSVLVLDNQTICIWNPRPSIYQLFIDFNIAAADLIEDYGGGEMNEYFLFSVLQDPDMSNKIVQEMIGKKIIGLDIVSYNDYREIELFGEPNSVFPEKYSAIIFHLEDGQRKALGIYMEDNIGEELEFIPANKIRPQIIKEIIPIRKEGYSIG